MTEKRFLQYYELLQAADKENLDSPYIQHGIVHIFHALFDASIQTFAQALRQDGDYLASMGSPREILLGAYEKYVFIDEETWLDMLEDRRRSTQLDVRNICQRILQRFLPAFTAVKTELIDKMPVSVIK